jgi:hypothetical protein
MKKVIKIAKTNPITQRKLAEDVMEGRVEVRQKAAVTRKIFDDEMKKVSLEKRHRARTKSQGKLAVVSLRMEPVLRKTLVMLADRYGYKSLSSLCLGLLKGAVHSLGHLPKGVKLHDDTPE